MSQASRAWLTDSRPDPELAWMVIASGLLHVVAVVAILLIPRGLMASAPPPIVAYTVKIIDPNSLGGRLPKGELREDKEPEGARAVAPKEEPKVEPKPPEPEPEPEPKVEEKPPEPPPVEEPEVVIPDKKKPPEPPKKVEPKKPTAKDVAKDKAKSAKPSKEEVARIERDKQIQEAIRRMGEKGTGKTPTGLGGREEGKGAALGIGGDGGGGGTVMGLDFIIYKNRVEGLFKQNWTWVGANPNLNVRIAFRIESTGNILDVRILQRSGDGTYDESVIRAIRASSPLPPPPEKYRDIFGNYTIDFVSGEMRSGG
jgi:TonB family protein